MTLNQCVECTSGPSQANTHTQHYADINPCSAPPRCVLQRLQVWGLWHFLLWHIMKSGNMSHTTFYQHPSTPARPCPSHLALPSIASPVYKPVNPTQREHSVCLAASSTQGKYRGMKDTGQCSRKLNKHPNSLLLQTTPARELNTHH